jgi:hypothetical protein
MQMNGLAELITIKHYWREWSVPRLVIAVLHNDDLNQVTPEMRAMEGAPKFAESQTLPSTGYAGFAASLGLQAIAVDKRGDIGPARADGRGHGPGAPIWVSRWHHAQHGSGQAGTGQDRPRPLPVHGRLSGPGRLVRHRAQVLRSQEARSRQRVLTTPRLNRSSPL